MYDAVTALQWVRDNIGFFGGDNTKVTIWGQSSGGMTAGLLMLSPLTSGLFSSVMMSSSPLSIAAPNCSWTEAATLRWAQQTRCAFNNSTGDWTTACLQSLTPSEIYNAVASAGQTILLGPPDWNSNFSPCVDGILIDQPPLALRLQGRYNSVPVLAGWNSDEGLFFTRNARDDIGTYTDDTFNQFINRRGRVHRSVQRRSGINAMIRYVDVAQRNSLRPVPADSLRQAASLMQLTYVSDKYIAR